jgi:hypothetical protein
MIVSIMIVPATEAGILGAAFAGATEKVIRRFVGSKLSTLSKNGLPADRSMG